MKELETRKNDLIEQISGLYKEKANLTENMLRLKDEIQKAREVIESKDEEYSDGSFRSF